MRLFILSLLLVGCTSSSNNSLNTVDDSAVQDMGQVSPDLDPAPAPDMLVQTDMLVQVQPDMTQASAPDMLAASTPDMTPAPDLMPVPDLMPPGPDMTGLYCHSNATSYPGDTSVWCSTSPITATSAADALAACQQYNGPARNPNNTCVSCIAYAFPSPQNRITYYGYSADVFVNSHGDVQCASSSPMWLYGPSGQHAGAGDIANPTGTAILVWGQWAP